jgi:hypothetical protein
VWLDAKIVKIESQQTESLKVDLAARQPSTGGKAGDSVLSYGLYD